MKSEQELNLVKGRIKREAEAKGISLSDIAHAFTVWGVYPNLVVYHGSFVTYEEAGALATELAPPKQGDLYIANWPHSTLDVYEF